MIRISATQLEQFRLLLDTDWMQESAVIDSIKGTLVQTPDMARGQAFHYLLEHPQPNLEGIYERNNWRFGKEVIDSILWRLPEGGVFETKIAKTVGKTREEDDLILVAKADYVAGLHVFEFKAPVGRACDVEKYERSVQWRIYAWLYEATKVTYHIASLYEEDDGLIRLKEVASMDLYPYPGLEQEVRSLIREFMHFVRQRNLEGYLRKEEKAVAR